MRELLPVVPLILSPHLIEEPQWPSVLRPQGSSVRNRNGTAPGGEQRGPVARLQRDWTTDTQTFDAILSQALEMADALTAGIRKQFPGRA